MNRSREAKEFPFWTVLGIWSFMVGAPVGIVMGLIWPTAPRTPPPSSVDDGKADAATFVAALAEHACAPNLVTVEKWVGGWWLNVKGEGAAPVHRVLGTNHRALTLQLEQLGLDSVPGSAILTECLESHRLEAPP